ncbi:MBL fold metallo-hydrolase [Terrihabitans rhizophilus]|uniref:MBL fold metallo-hydrolase n=1 Tax=Terrihabitans rhizophilus TaxID=3092662 RepID=A0ABU4RKT9_9HYPH|nr:MBL fold metallo-hydrolase [Terrihabitans sp. PJ23]MDX6805196.1 MBL fold metallo-hydrolase [Terrihabitans sp. PJ23]
MTQQIPLSDNAKITSEADDGTMELAPDLAYIRALIANVVFYGAPGAGDRGWVLIDAGVFGTKDRIKSAAEGRFGEGARPAAIVLTHGHFDHVGVLEDLAEEWDVPVYAHDLEHPYLDGRASYPSGDPSVGGGLMAGMSSLYPTRPVDVSSRLHPLPQDGSVPHMPGWTWVHTPGHSPGHVSLWREADRTMIVGDAFVTTASESAYASAVQAAEMHGPPKYFTIDWDASEASVAKLAALHPSRIITGHGRAMEGPEMDSALQRLSRDFRKIAVPSEGKYVANPARAADGSAYLKP